MASSRLVVDGEWVNHHAVDGEWTDWYTVEGEF